MPGRKLVVNFRNSNLLALRAKPQVVIRNGLFNFLQLGDRRKQGAASFAGLEFN